MFIYIISIKYFFDSRGGREQGRLPGRERVCKGCYITSFLIEYNGYAPIVKLYHTTTKSSSPIHFLKCD